MADCHRSLKLLVEPAAYSTLVAVARAWAQERYEPSGAAAAAVNLEAAFDRFVHSPPTDTAEVSSAAEIWWDTHGPFPPERHNRKFLKCLDAVVSLAHCNHARLEALLGPDDYGKLVAVAMRMARATRVPSHRVAVDAYLAEAYHRFIHTPPKSPLQGSQDAQERTAVAQALISEADAVAYLEAAFGRSASTSSQATAQGVPARHATPLSSPAAPGPSGEGQPPVARFWWGSRPGFPPEGQEARFYTFLKIVMYEVRRRNWFEAGGESDRSSKRSDRLEVPVPALTAQSKRTAPPETDGLTPERVLLEKEAAKARYVEEARRREELAHRIIASMPEFDREVWRLQTLGKTAQEIAVQLRCSKTTIDNTNLVNKARYAAVLMAMMAERQVPLPRRTPLQEEICRLLVAGLGIGEICRAAELEASRRLIYQSPGEESHSDTGFAANPGSEGTTRPKGRSRDRVRNFVKSLLSDIVALFAAHTVETDEEN